MSWNAWVMTLFPEMFPGSLDVSLTGRALENGLWGLETVDIRDFASDKHRSVDDTPFGGGPGMVLRADILGPAIDDTVAKAGADDLPLIYLSPRGKPFTQGRARELAAGPGAIFLCGRFEGIDERVLEARKIEEVSLGDFVMTGGELAAMALIDATVRLLPGVVGDPDSLADESFEAGLLEYPQYTRPQEWEGLGVPEALLSGNHGRIAGWRLEQSELLTKERRP
ncbi:MAG: tRNA (guanosine(37)-N1)-methyltransferase TrmD, partial [Alphaproteobacteria bacterium]|nr:tRNA (guanosine(37)-N1)-methyltransferase TrmD [Alphaproteobacteria bacterium]MBT4085429.1 tRNA (guanosine(37)-N1)-methyltransferase TrmD [Alphaproteobacteria bacterium]